MKYFNIILLVVIILAVGAGAYFFFVQPLIMQKEQTGSTDSLKTAGVTADTKPADFAVSFYKWYLKKAIEDPAFIVVESFEAPQWVSKEFITTVETKIQNDRLYSDPVFLSEDYQTDWIEDITAKVTRESEKESVVLVELGGKQPKTISIRLVKSDGTWHVDSISLP